MVCIVVVMVCVVVLHGMYSCCYGLCSSFAWYVQLLLWFVYPKGIYRRNIGDYLRQPYLWVKYR